MATFNAVFKQVYGEALEPLGFVKIKGRHPHFVRLIGDEIIHVITYRNRPCTKPGYKEFMIEGGVATVYRQSIDLTPTGLGVMRVFMVGYILLIVIMNTEKVYQLLLIR